MSGTVLAVRSSRPQRFAEATVGSRVRLLCFASAKIGTHCAASVRPYGSSPKGRVVRGDNKVDAPFSWSPRAFHPFLVEELVLAPMSQCRSALAVPTVTFSPFWFSHQTSRLILVADPSGTFSLTIALSVNLSSA